jgi:TetR/AcrR family transcriptional regulator, transcriptional repressor for nem operon
MNQRDRGYPVVTDGRCVMRVSKQQVAQNRQRIVDSAIRMFGERGVDSVGVAEVMADAGFTHGGFYNHFSSKEDLVRQACSTALSRSVDSLRESARGRHNGTDIGESLSAPMLSASSQTSELASVYADGLRGLLDVLNELVGDREAAVDELCRFVGARVISRAVEPADRELADEFAAATRPPHETQRPSRLRASS